MNLKYQHISQKPYCCVPACIQMVLRRRRMPFGSQSNIGYELGMILPPSKRGLHIKSHRGTRPPTGWGTRINLKEYSLSRFFKKNNLPLIEKYYSIASFMSPQDLRGFIRKKLNSRNDLLVCFNYPLLYSKKGNWGHASLISSISSNRIELVDPGRKYKETRKIQIQDLYKAIKEHHQGGVWVITSL